MQGGPHNHRIASTAAMLKYAASEEFHKYSVQTKKNSLALQNGFLREGLLLGFGGKSDTHIVYIDTLSENFNKKEIEIASQCAGLEVSAGLKGPLLATLESTRRGISQEEHEGFVASTVAKVLRQAKRINKEAVDLRQYANIAKRDDTLSHLNKEVKEFTS